MYHSSIVATVDLVNVVSVVPYMIVVLDFVVVVVELVVELVEVVVVMGSLSYCESVCSHQASI